MQPTRRQLVLGSVALAAASGLPLGLARAQGTWPHAPIKFIIPYPPGGSSDILGRVMADRLQNLLKAPAVVPDNRPGGAASIGVEFGARAAPDGNTLILGPAPVFTVVPHLRKLNFDMDSFVVIAGVAEYVALVTVRNDLPVHTLGELIALAKKQPGKLTVGSAGIASAGHVFAEVLKQQAGIDVLHVPFKGSSEAATALLGGQVDFIIDGVGLALARSGRARAVACFSNAHHAQMPQVPTLAEAGLKIDLPPAGWAVMAPKGTPAPIVEQVSAALKTAIAEPDTRAKLETAGLVPLYTPGPQYRNDMEKGKVFFGELVKSTGMKAE